jgi:hypothetical protein
MRRTNVILTTLFLALKLMTVYVEPENALAKDDQTLATCAVSAMTARPSALKILPSKEMADVTFVVGNHAGLRIHVLGRLTLPDGTVLVEVNHVTHGLNHSLCHQVDGLLDEMAKKLAEKKPSVR